MKIIIAGIGKIGAGLGARLLHEGHDITLLDTDADRLAYNAESKDLLTVHGNCASMETLMEAGVITADVLIAVTESDERNLLTCMTAHNMNSRIKTIARVRTPEYAETTGMFFDNYGLNMTIDPQQYAAKDVEAILNYPGFIHRERFTEGMTDVIALDLPEGHRLCGHPLVELPSIMKMRALICVVVRDGDALTPGGDFVLEAGDRIYVTANTEDLNTLVRSFGVDKKKKVRRVLIIGGGDTTSLLLSELKCRAYDITVVERNRQLCEELAARFPDVSVVHGDGRKLSMLERLDLDKQDAMICLTGSDEANTILGVFANIHNIPEVIIKLKDMDYGKIFDKKAKGTIINPRRLVGDAIVRYLRAQENESNAAVSVRSVSGNTQIAEFIIGPGSAHCGEPLKDIRFKSNVLLASVNRYGRNILPGADTMFLNGDRVLAVFSRDDIRGFNDLFR